jgi:hypothetical protein
VYEPVCIKLNWYQAAISRNVEEVCSISIERQYKSHLYPASHMRVLTSTPTESMNITIEYDS